MEFIRRNLLWLSAALGLLLLVAIVAAIFLSLPPRQFTILSGREGGAYFQFAQQYREVAAEYGFDLRVQPTAGSVETLQLLDSGAAQVGFVQGGIAQTGDATKLSTMASVFHEPIWIIYRQGLNFAQPPDDLLQLQGLRIGVGEAGSGSHDLALRLLADSGVSAANSSLVEDSSQSMADSLRSGDLDVAFFVLSLTSPLIQELLVDPSLALMSLRRADAFARRYVYLSSMVIPEGTVDLQKDRPPADVQVLSTVANVVVSNDLHPDLLRLLTIAAVRTHEMGSLLDRRFEFPNVLYADLPVNKEASAYMNRIKSGESILDNYFPFWLAALIDRYLLFVVPIALLLLPMLSRSPLLYQFYMRNRIVRWYHTIRSVELRLETTVGIDIDREIAELRALDERLTKELSVSNTYMPDVYNLRTNIDFVITKLERRKAQLHRAAQAARKASGAVGGAPAAGDAAETSVSEAI